MISVGSILQNRYRIVRLLAQGGMGAVYEARDERLGHTVAVKQTLCSSDQLCKAFEREARLLADLRHPALPKVSDHFLEGCGQFLVMEFIPGQDLGRLLERYGQPFPIEHVLQWGEQLFDVLEFLHSHHPPIIHRDLKPANLKLTETGQLVLLDFGLAKGLATRVSRGVVQDSLIAYTPGYAPLEQIQGTGTDTRSDLFALAATLYHLLTGTQAPDALTRSMSIVSSNDDPLRPAHQVKSDIPVVISRMLQDALALNPAQRPANVAAMRQCWREAMRIYGIPTGNPFVPAHFAPLLPADETAKTCSADFLSKAVTLCHVVKDKVSEVAEFTSIWLGQIALREELVPQTTPEFLPQSPTLASPVPVSAHPKVVDLRSTRDLIPPARKSWAWYAVGAVLLTILTGAGVLAFNRKSPKAEYVVTAAPTAETPNSPKPETVNPPAKVLNTKPVETAKPAVEPAGWGKPSAKPVSVTDSTPVWQPPGAKTKLDLVWIPAGSFTMGGNSRFTEENPAHRVTIQKPFYLGKFEVTQAQWKTVMGNNPSAKSNLNDSSPVDSVSWEEIQEFLKRLNALDDGFTYRLPTEAEWEYAARAGSSGKYFFGNDGSQLKHYAWYLENSGGTTHPVGQKRPNAWGLHDMLGNVQEWCQDRFHKSYRGAPADGSAWETQSGEHLRVERGSAWDTKGANAYSSSRGWNVSSRRFSNAGFRVVAVPKPK